MDLELDFGSPFWRKFALDFCRRGCPELSEEELAEAAESFLDYLKIVWRQHQRMEAEGKLDEVMALVRRNPRGLRAQLVSDLVSRFVGNLEPERRRFSNFSSIILPHRQKNASGGGTRCPLQRRSNLGCCRCRNYPWSANMGGPYSRLHTYSKSLTLLKLL
jgi:hypothetical protein